MTPRPCLALLAALCLVPTPAALADGAFSVDDGPAPGYARPASISRARLTALDTPQERALRQRGAAALVALAAQANAALPDLLDNVSDALDTATALGEAILQGIDSDPARQPDFRPHAERMAP